MKAGINGAPTLSSRDGGALELIKDEVNGWLFGEDIRDFIDIYNDPRAKEINEREYKEFEKKLLSIIDLYNSDKEKFLEISMNAVKTFAQAADIKNVLRKYYIRDH